MDARLTPVDEDLLLYSSTDRPSPGMFKLFKENEWNMIDCGIREDCRSTSDNCGPGIHLNMLCLAPRLMIVERNEKQLIKTLREEGCDVIPIEFSACYPWGGGLNCFTLDIYRQGAVQKSYFPTLDRKAEQEDAKAEAALLRKRRLAVNGLPTAPPSDRKSRRVSPSAV